MNFQMSGLRTLSIGATLTYGAQPGDAVGLFIQGIGEMVVINPGGGSPTLIADGDPDAPINAPFGSSIPLMEILGFTNGSAVKLELQETSHGIFEVTVWLNGAIVKTASNVNLPNFPTTGFAGVAAGGQTASNPHTCASWQNLSIQCQQTGGCSLYPAVPSVWEVAAIPGITDGTAHACTSCSPFASPGFLYFISGSPTCVWQAADTLKCPNLSGAQFTGPIWSLTVGSSLVTLTAAPSSGGIATYTMPVGAFNPLGSNTLTLQGTPWGCVGWLPSIGVAPG
jgi:hypothetical protein